MVGFECYEENMAEIKQERSPFAYKSKDEMQDSKRKPWSQYAKLMKRVKTRVSYNDLFVNAYVELMRSPLKFYILNSNGRPAETNPPEEILPDEKYDVIAVEAVQYSDELMREAVNPEIWRLFLSHKLASRDAARAVRGLASGREQVFEACKKEGKAWYNGVVLTEEESLWDVEKHSDYGWYCIAVYLISQREWLAFFAFLSKIETAVKDVIWEEVVNKVKVFGELFQECGIGYPEGGFERFLLKDTPLRKISPYQNKDEVLSRIHKDWQVYAWWSWSNKMMFLNEFSYDEAEFQRCLKGSAVYPLEMCELGSLDHLDFKHCQES